MRSVFAIAPLAIVLAWLSPQPGSRAHALSGTPGPWMQAAAPQGEDPSSMPLAPMGFRYSSLLRSRDALARDASSRPPAGVSSVSLLEAAVVR